MNILLVEDMAGFAKPIKAQLEALGHNVTWIAGVESLGESRVRGILASPDAAPLDDAWNGEADRLVDIDLTTVNLALCDGQFLGPVSNGVDVVQTLVRNGIIAVGISGGGNNAPMLAVGARIGLPKEFIVLALRHGRLIPEQCLAHPEAVNRRLVAYCAELRAQAIQCMQHKQKFDYGYPEVP